MKQTRSDNPFDQYLADVERNPKYYSPEIIAQCEIQREMLKKYDFIEEKGRHCVEWIEKFCVLTEGENAGKPVKLMLWQKWIIYSVLCFYGDLEVEEFDENGYQIGNTVKYVRVVNDVLLLIASGNSKTTFMSFLIAYFLFHSDIPSPKIYIGSNAYKQSRLCFDSTMKLIRRNKVLKDNANVRNTIGEIEVEKTNAKLVAMSSDGTNFEGIIPAVLMIDEIHGFRTSKYPDDLRKSTKRSDALTFETTTDGTVRGGYLDDRKELAHALLFGNSEIKDYRKFFAIYKQESYEEVIHAYESDISLLRKSNPGLGVSVQVDMLKGKIVDMINDPKKRVVTLTKNFNIPQNPITSYFTERECRAKEFNENIFYNAPVFLGLDMAYTRNPANDLACLEMLVYNPITEEEFCKDMFFLPKYWEEERKDENGEVVIDKRNMLQAKSKEDANVLYSPKQGKYGYEMYAARGDVVVIDEDLVEELVAEFGEQARCDCTGVTEDFIIYYIAHLELKYEWIICKFGLDPNKAQHIEAFMNANIPSLDGKPPVVKFRMEDKKNSNPIIASTKEIRQRGLVYNNNRLTELHFAAAQAREDQYGNIVFTNTMRERKDGVIANLAARSAVNVFLHNKDTGDANTEYLKGWFNGE